MTRMDEERRQVMTLFYTQIVGRVRAKYEEKHPDKVHIAEAIEQKWRRQLSCYTGIRMARHWESSETPSTEPLGSERDPPGRQTEPRVGPEHNHSRQHAVGAPALSMLPSRSTIGSNAAPRSIFGRLYGLNKKRKLPQVDGEFVVDNLHEEPDEHKEEEEHKRGPPQELTTNPSVDDQLGSNSYNIARYPCLLSAQYTQFKYRASTGVWQGKLQCVILTIARRLTEDEEVQLGNLLWLFAGPATRSERHPGSSISEDSDAIQDPSPLEVETALVDRPGALVEVVDLLNATTNGKLEHLRVKLPNGTVQTIQRRRLRRLNEQLVRQALVTLQLISFLPSPLSSVKMPTPCLVSFDNEDSIVHEGPLKYRSSDGTMKERWFVLDATTTSLVKCSNTKGHHSPKSGDTFGGPIGIREVQPLALIYQNAQLQRLASEPPLPPPPEDERFGFELTTPKDTKVRLFTKTEELEKTWTREIKKHLHGFTKGVADKLANRELLADKYSLVRELGRGASGIVSLYTYQGKPFAVKKLHANKEKRLPFRSRFSGPKRGSQQTNDTNKANAVPENVRREIALLKKASNLPHFIKLYEVILDPEHGNYYMVMEYMGGGPVATWNGQLKRYVCPGSNSGTGSSIADAGSCDMIMDEATVRKYMVDLLIGIKALHANRLCHRDIKPENLLANETRTECKIADMGVAHYFRKDVSDSVEEENDVKELEEMANQSTAHPHDPVNGTSPPASPSKPKPGHEKSFLRKGLLRNTKGTYHFLSPESLSGEEFDAYKVDIWAIGVTLYALLYGQLPFLAGDIVALFDQIESKALEFPPTAKDEDAKSLVRGLLEKDPSKRMTLDEALAHKWIVRGGSKTARTIHEQVKEIGSTKEMEMSLEENELYSAVSLLQDRFQLASAAVKQNDMNFLEKMPSEGSNSGTFGSRELDFSEYVPHPVETDKVEIPAWMMNQVDNMSSQLHFDWCRSRCLDGWKPGKERNDEQMIHPGLVPHHLLDQEMRDKNTNCVIETLKCILALHCRVRYQPPSRFKAKFQRVPFRTDKISLSWQMMMLVDLLAENSHEVWAQSYFHKGWTYGTTFDAEQKTHPSLKPYMCLEEKEKNLSREGICSILKTCIYLGFEISVSNRPS